MDLLYSPVIDADTLKIPLIETVDALIYFNPVVTLLASSLVLNESLTAISLVGAALVLGGVFIADRRVMKE